MSPIITNPTDVRARYAGRLAHQHHAVREAWRVNKSPELAEDLKKALWYTWRELDRIEGDTP